MIAVAILVFTIVYKKLMIKNHVSQGGAAG
jgi:hypothetical protein